MWSLADASPDRLRELARNIETSGRWISFLTPQEYQLFVVALNHSLDTWSRFLRGKIPCQLRFAGADDNVVITEMDPVTLAFRVRYMLWEFQIDKLNDTDYADEEEFTSHRHSTSGSQESKERNSAVTSKRNDDSDDYDDDYDDNGDDPSKVDSSSQDSQSRIEVLVVDTKQEDSEPDPRGRIGAVQNSSKMYDTFDLDAEKMKRYQRLKDSDEQIGEDGDSHDPSISSEYNSYHSSSTGNTDIGGGSGLQAFAKTAQFGSANLCLKHLLTTIESKRSELHVTNIELRNLISDVRKNRSKWASEERIGQEELYEACERVVQELRGTTEHSTAFLNKVSKREAPNYYEVIKHPMDLNTVMRKLRALQYNSKKEFVDDLDLIWSNCLTYNSDPSHFLRVHAIAMRKKTQALAPLIPDVIIRSRAEVEAEAEELEKQAKEQRKRRGSDSDSGGHSSKRKVGVTIAGAKDSEGETNDNSTADQTSNTVTSSDRAINGNTPGEPSNVNANGPSFEDMAGKDLDQVSVVDKASASETVKASGTTPSDPTENIDEHPGGETDNDDGDMQTASGYLIEEEEYKVPDVESAFWSSATRRRRIQCITSRQMLFTGGKLQMDAPISIRTPGSMARFDKAIRSEDVAGQMSSLSLLSTDIGEEPFMIEYEASAGIPPPPLSDNSLWITAPIPKLQELPPSKYLSTGLLPDVINRNLNEMQMIRRLCAKILYIKDLQSGQLAGVPAATETDVASGGFGIGSGSAVEYPSIKDPEPDISSRLPGSTIFDSRAAYSSIRRSVAKIAMHSGFEAAHPRAVDILASIAGDYLTKLGETLVANLEAPGSTASFSSILSSSLDTMGITQPNQLTRYISHDVLKQGRRLCVFRSRLNNMLVEILRPEVDRYQDDQFNDNSEQFVLGQFSNELGDDYFGFKELGINDELGVSSIAIPFHLLQQRVAYQDTGESQHGIRRKLGLGVPEYPPLTSNDIDKLPQLIKPAFQNMLLKNSNGETMHSKEHSSSEVQDETQQIQNDPNREYIAQLASQAASARAKVPASGKLAPRKKRFERAYIVVTPEPSYASESTAGEPKDSNSESEEAADTAPAAEAVKEDPEQPDYINLERDVSDADADADADVELSNIGSLAFGPDETTPSSNGFVFNDNIATGSLLLQGDEEEEDTGYGAEDIGFDFLKK